MNPARHADNVPRRPPCFESFKCHSFIFSRHAKCADRREEIGETRTEPDEKSGGRIGMRARTAGSRTARRRRIRSDARCETGDGTDQKRSEGRKDSKPTAAPLQLGCVPSGGITAACSASPLDVLLHRPAQLGTDFFRGVIVPDRTEGREKSRRAPVDLKGEIFDLFPLEPAGELPKTLPTRKI